MRKALTISYLIGSGLTLYGLSRYFYLKSQVPENAPSTLPLRVARWWDKIKKYAYYFNLDPLLVASIIEIESGGNPNAKNPKSTATGLMQVIYGTAMEMGVDPSLLTDPDWNIYAGCKYLRTLIDRYGDIYKAVYSYYAGSYPSSQYHSQAVAYASEVLGIYDSIKDIKV